MTTTITHPTSHGRRSFLERSTGLSQAPSRAKGYDPTQTWRRAAQAHNRGEREREASGCHHGSLPRGDNECGVTPHANETLGAIASQRLQRTQPVHVWPPRAPHYREGERERREIVRTLGYRASYTRPPDAQARVKRNGGVGGRQVSAHQCPRRGVITPRHGDAIETLRTAKWHERDRDNLDIHKTVDR